MNRNKNQWVKIPVSGEGSKLKICLSSPTYENGERNRNEWHKANGLFAPWKLFWSHPQLCENAGRL